MIRAGAARAGQKLWRSALLGLLALLSLAPAQAHLMVAQKGTLNLVGGGAFMVMSLPVAAFSGVDDDGDGRLSVTELRAHAADIERQVRRGVQLLGDYGAAPLEGLMLNLSPDDRTPTAPAEHLVVMGRFALDTVGPSPALFLNLYGHTAATQQQEVTVTRGDQTQRLLLAPGREQQTLLPSAFAVFFDHAQQGAHHVLSGLDHLLFLLVVLATGWGWRQIVWALTAFTAGHALTLAASALGGLSVSPAIVEPAIALTIVAMAVFDRWSAGRAQPLAPAWRLALVFGCALIHGLGLAGALTGLGLDRTHQLLSLAGFNLGIEAAQLAVALAAAALMAVVARLRGAAGLALATRFASFTAMAAGSVWFAQRVFAAG